VEVACRRALTLINQLAGGTLLISRLPIRVLVSTILDSLDELRQNESLYVGANRLETLGELATVRYPVILSALGCQVTPGPDKE